MGTTVINLKASAATFGFIPPHGRRLGPNEQMTVAHDLFAHVANNARKRQSLQRAMDNGHFAVLRTPAVQLFDAVSGEVRQLRINNGTLGTVDPCYGDVDLSVSDPG